MNDTRRNKKTTAAGIVALVLAGLSIWQNPQAASTDPQVIGQLVAGVGLVLAKDQDQTGTAPKKTKAR